MMVYSNGGDTTNSHIRYWKLSLFWGMWRVRGLALMAKSIQALCKITTTVFVYLSRFPPPTLRTHPRLSPRSFPNCSPPSSCLLAPERWWWWEPRRCWRRRRGRPRSTPRKRWTSPSGILGSDPGSRKSHLLNVSAPCEWQDRRSWLHVCRERIPDMLPCSSTRAYCGHPSPVETVKRVRRAQATLS